MSHFQQLCSKLLVLGVTLSLAALAIGCTGAASEAPAGGRPEAIVVPATVFLPTPTPRPTLTPNPTPTTFTLVSIEEVLAPLKRALDNYEDPEKDRALLVQVLRETVGSFLAAAPQPLTQTTVETLTTGIQSLMSSPADTEPVVALADLDQDGQLDLVIGLPWLYGIPAMAFVSGQHYTGAALPGLDEAASTSADDLLLYAWPAAAMVEDVTGDHRPDLVVAYTAPGGSGVTERLYTFQWQPDQRAFTLIFQATLISWAAESTWQTQPGPNDSQAFVLAGPAFGPFDHKLLPHPTRTQVWQWDKTAGRFVMASETFSTPETPRQQFNLAESLLRQGEYEQAAVEFHKVLTTTATPELAALEDSSTDWPALAHLRLGQTYALLGYPEDARAELGQAEAAGSTIGELASAFLQAYQEEDVTRAWAAMLEEVNLEELLYNESAGNLGFPVDAFGLYYPGLAVAAYLDRHPEAVTGAVGDLMVNLTLAGFNLKAVLIEDISGDGQPEVAFVRREWAQNTDRLWLAYHQDSRWRVTLLTDWDNMNLEGVIMLPQADNVLLVTFPSAASRPPTGYTWGPDGVTVFLLDGEATEPEPHNLWPTLGGL